MRIALTIAGSDSGGGAGIQADLKTFQQFGVFGTTALVAVTAQNTMGVSAVHSIPPKIVTAQIEAVASDLPPDAVKTGMLATAELVSTVAEALRRLDLPNLVVDPVMVATTGDPLLEKDAIERVVADLLPLATLVTPNVPEAELLSGVSISTPEDMETAGRVLLGMGAGAVLVKGGHLEDSSLTDVLLTGEAVVRFERARVDTVSTHGTGCALSAAVTAGLALGDDLHRAVSRALDFVARAIRTAPGLGRGHGPLNLLVPVEKT